MLPFPVGLMLVWVAFLLCAPSAHAANVHALALEIVNHRFVPEHITAPANTPIVVTVRNRDATPEEFESDALQREKVIPGHSTAKVFLGALDPGTYPFIGDFHQKTAQGTLTITPTP